MIDFSLIIFSWKRPKLLESDEVILGNFILAGGRNCLILQFRRQLDKPLPSLKLPFDEWLKSRNSEFVRVVEPYDILLVLGSLLVSVAFAWYVGFPAIEWPLLKIFGMGFASAFGIYFGTLFLAFRAYRKWLDDLESKAQLLAPWN